jgi:hypothetical protein
MQQRGKRSAASLEVTGIEDAGPNLRPPPHLTAKEAALFREVVATSPSGQFSASDVYLLTTFVHITSLLEGAAASARKANDNTRQMKFKMLAELAKTQSLIATKLRLVPSARIAPRTAGRAHDAHRPSAYDTMGFDREFFEDGWTR